MHTYTWAYVHKKCCKIGLSLVLVVVGIWEGEKERGGAHGLRPPHVQLRRAVPRFQSWRRRADAALRRHWKLPWRLVGGGRRGGRAAQAAFPYDAAGGAPAGRRVVRQPRRAGPGEEAPAHGGAGAGAGAELRGGEAEAGAGAEERAGASAGDGAAAGGRVVPEPPRAGEGQTARAGLRPPQGRPRRAPRRPRRAPRRQRPPPIAGDLTDRETASQGVVAGVRTGGANRLRVSHTYCSSNGLCCSAQRRPRLYRDHQRGRGPGAAALRRGSQRQPGVLLRRRALAALVVGRRLRRRGLLLLTPGRIARRRRRGARREYRRRGGADEQLGMVLELIMGSLA